MTFQELSDLIMRHGADQYTVHVYDYEYSEECNIDPDFIDVDHATQTILLKPVG